MRENDIDGRNGEDKKETRVFISIDDFAEF